MLCNYVEIIPNERIPRSKHLSASVLFKTARAAGFTCVLDYLAKQDYESTWELIIVDANRGANFELVHDYWYNKRPDVDMVHVSPLDPVAARPERMYWDIMLYMNTGWCYARGDVSVNIEDHMVMKSGWLREHCEFIAKHPNMISIGHVHNEPVFNEYSSGLYGRGRSIDYQTKQLNQFPKLQDAFNDPTLMECTNKSNYAIIFPGNMAVKTQHIIDMNGIPECNTHHPELLMMECFNQGGLSVWPQISPYASAWHFYHEINTINTFVIKRDHINNPSYEPIKREEPINYFNIGEVEHLKRDLREKRKEIHRWLE